MYFYTSIFENWERSTAATNINIRVLFVSPHLNVLASSTISFCNKWNTLFYSNFQNTLTSIVFCLLVGICIMCYRKPEKMEKACGLFAPASLASPRFTILSSNHYINTYKARLPMACKKVPSLFTSTKSHMRMWVCTIDSGANGLNNLFVIGFPKLGA